MTATHYSLLDDEFTHSEKHQLEFEELNCYARALNWISEHKHATSPSHRTFYNEKLKEVGCYECGISTRTEHIAIRESFGRRSRSADLAEIFEQGTFEQMYAHVASYSFSTIIIRSIDGKESDTIVPTTFFIELSYITWLNAITVPAPKGDHTCSEN